MLKKKDILQSDAIKNACEKNGLIFKENSDKKINISLIGEDGITRHIDSDMNSNVALYKDLKLQVGNVFAPMPVVSSATLLPHKVSEKKHFVYGQNESVAETEDSYIDVHLDAYYMHDIGK